MTKKFAASRYKAVLLISCLAVLITGCKTASPNSARKTRNVILITTDGFRWQEMFGGADEKLLADKEFTGNPNRMKLVFGRPTPEERRKRLLPFIWGEIATHGQIYGNPAKGSVVRVTNGKNFSYPGYNEFLTGSADPRIASNDAKPNPNTNVFEWLNLQPQFHGRVAGVVNWKVIPWILNTPRSQLPVWSGYAVPPGAPELHPPEILERTSADITPIFSDIIFDAFTRNVAADYLAKHQPRVLYLAFGETDEWAHEGRYDRYLVAASRVDGFIWDLWEQCQALPQYRDKTTFIITTDHGRGANPGDWRDHGEKISGSDKTWVAILGPDTPPLGERTNCAPITASQIAATVAAFLGEDFRQANPNAAPPIPEAIGNSNRAPRPTHDHDQP